MVSFHILSILLCQTIFHYQLTIAVGEIYKSPNVKTALFTELDVRRSCWNHEELNLLRSRMIMQDLIPNKVPRDFQYLLEYLRSTEEAVVKHSPEGDVRRIMMTALSDVLGGYLQSVAIPLAKENYYAGNIDYTTLSRLYETLNEIKHRLRTDGGRWSRPIDINKFSVKVTPLVFPMSNSELACKALFVVPEDKCSPGMPRIAIPYLDYDEKPGAVALPLKSRNLYSLKTAASSHIIVRFYIIARQCLSKMPAGSTEVFNRRFVTWLTNKVIPHLYEDVWYPGFGSVMRILETVNETKLIFHHRRQFKSNDSSLESSLSDGSIGGYIANMKAMAKYNTAWFLAYVLLVLSAVVIVLCCCCYCVRFSRTGEPLGGKASSSVQNFELSDYYVLKDKKDSKLDPKVSPREPLYYFSGTLHHPSEQPTEPYPQDRSPPETDGDTSSYTTSLSDEESGSSLKG